MERGGVYDLYYNQPLGGKINVLAEHLGMCAAAARLLGMSGVYSSTKKLTVGRVSNTESVFYCHFISVR